MNKKTIHYEYIIFGIVATLCFFTFQHGDIRHTVGCSYAYLEGHFLDFYDYSAKFDLWPSYMPSTYITFAIWLIPMKILGFRTSPHVEFNYWLIMYYKLLPTLFYLASSYVMTLIAKELGMGEKKARYCGLAFLTMPIGFFSQFIFGQYDSFTVLFVLLGIYYYFKDRRFLFILFFALSLPYKYFSLLIFIPLLLLKEKNVWKILRDVVLVVIPYALEFIIYYPSIAFRQCVLGFAPTDYVYNSSINTGFMQLNLIVVLWCLICVWAYFKQCNNKLDWAKWAFYFCMLSCLSFFGLSYWHPQWLLFIVPFWVMSSFLNRDVKACFFLDFLLMAAFCVYIVNANQMNTDQNLFRWGIFGLEALGKDWYEQLSYKLMMKDIYGITDLNFLGTVFTSLLAISAFSKHPKYGIKNIEEEIPKATKWMLTRLIAGIAIFVVPAAACYVVAVMPPYVNMEFYERGGVTRPLIGKKLYSQVFTAQSDSIERIDFLVATYGRINYSNLIVSLYDYNTNIRLYEEVLDCSEFSDAGWIPIEPKVSAVKGQKYRLEFEAPNGSDLNCISIYHTPEKSATEENYAAFRGVKEEFNLCIRVYGKERVTIDDRKTIKEN